MKTFPNIKTVLTEIQDYSDSRYGEEKKPIYKLVKDKMESNILYIIEDHNQNLMPFNYYIINGRIYLSEKIAELYNYVYDFKDIILNDNDFFEPNMYDADLGD